jgi:hypothetical protein
MCGYSRHISENRSISDATISTQRQEDPILGDPKWLDRNGID